MKPITLITIYGLLNPLTQTFYSILHQQIMITYITYTIANHYYMRHLAIETESLQTLRTKGQKLKTEIPMITSTSEFRQVTK
jgi:hypothetical protein